MNIVKILLIDDSYEFTEPVKELLEREGYTVDVIANSNEAYDKTENLEDYKLILLDLMFIVRKIKLGDNPEVGILLYKKIRDKYTKIPIIIVSALNRDRFKKHFEGDDFVKYVSKPLSANIEELKISIKSFLV